MVKWVVDVVKWVTNMWGKIPWEVQEFLKWLFDKHLAEVIMLGGGLPTLWLIRRKIIDAVNRFRDGRNLRKRLPDYTPQQIERGTRYYIWPDCQDVDPAQSDEARHTVAVRHDLCSTMDQRLTQDTVHKHYIILADTGMGKTSFLLNYFARHLRRWRKPFAMELVPLSVPGLKDRLKKIPSPENTVLLLDAFDEDPEAVENHTKRLNDIMQWTRELYFYRVVITCRTQFFPRDEEIPVETGIMKVGPREAGEGPQFTFYKLYLSPFSDQQVQAYLKRRFSFWRKSRRRQVRAIVDKAPNLAVRPMLLSHVDDLINSGKSFENCYQIYTEMVDAWLERERVFVKAKEALYQFSCKLAVKFFVNRVEGKSERVHYDAIESLAERFGIKLATWQLTGRSLLNRDAEGNYKFAHRSIMEFLFVQQLLNNDQDALQIPALYWTEQVIPFLNESVCGKSPWRFPLPLRFVIIFVPFKGGVFQLGGTGKTVEVKPFALSKYQVTNSEYEEFDSSHREKRNKYSDQDDQPVVNVSWEDAERYCQWLSKKTGENYRLPMEAEWEFAASGGGKRHYPWGNEEPSPKYANYQKLNIGKTTPVGSYPLGMTPEGLFDMAGNVWEWCADWYDEKQKYHVVRGGSFLDDYLHNLRCAARNWGVPLVRDDDTGFRVVRGTWS
ncbi:MAG: SUMF1/EgtB/PvdO family nonheme iron enzyme [bacterium]